MSGTLIQTAQGEKAIEHLAIGDLVKTSTGLAPIKWIGRWNLPSEILEARPNLRPIVFEPNSVGNERRLKISRQHCVVMSLSGKNVLVRAGHLEKHSSGRIRISLSSRPIVYFHILLEGHDAIYANGILAESLYPNATSFEFTRPVKLWTNDNERKTFLPVLESAEVRHALQNHCLAPPIPTREDEEPLGSGFITSR